MDKQVTRWAAMGVRRCLMFNRWWDLERGRRYRVRFNRARPGESVVEALP